jgi:hypothetical protein
LKKTITKKRGAGGMAQGVGPEFKPQYHKNQPNKKQNQVAGEWEDTV